MAEYFIKIKDQRNNPVIFIDNFYSLELNRNEMGIGSLYVDIPLKEYGNIDFAIDWRIEVYRKSGTGDVALVGDTQWMIKLVRRKVDEQNKQLLHILAYDPIYILSKYIVAYVAGTPQALKENMPADDMIKAIARENLGALATDPDRDLSHWLVIEDDKGLAPKITMDDFSFQQVLPILTKICEKSSANGTYLTFDIVYDSEIEKLVLKTYTGQRGANRGQESFSPLYLSHHTDYANIMGGGTNYASTELDASDEATYIYSGRQAADINALFAVVANQSAINESPFGRREDFITTGESVEKDDVIAEAYSWLQHKYRKVFMNTHVQNNTDMRYGIDYGFGDLVAFRYLGESFDIHLDGIKISVDGKGSEEITPMSSSIEKELMIDAGPEPDADVIIKNECDEDDDRIAIPLYHKHHSVAQSFINTNPWSDEIDRMYTIEYVDILMRRVGLPEKNVTMTLRSDNGGEPGAILSGSFATVTYDYIPDGLYTWIRFKFPAPVSVKKGITYWAVLTCGTQKIEKSNYYRIGIDKKMLYKPGQMKVSLDGQNWDKHIGYTGYEESDEDVGWWDFEFDLGWKSVDFDMPFAVSKSSEMLAHTSGDSAITINDSTQNVLHTFSGVGFDIAEASYYIKRFGFPGNLQIDICEWDAVNKVPLDSIGSASVDSLDVASTPKWKKFNFLSPVQSVVGVTYCIVISASGTTATDGYEIGSSNPGINGSSQSWKSNFTDWSELNADIPFRLYNSILWHQYTTTTGKIKKLNNVTSSRAQSFVVPSFTEITGVSVYIRKVGHPGSLTISICQDNDGTPGGALAECAIDAAEAPEYPSPFGWVQKELHKSVACLPDTQYYIVISSDETDRVNYYELSVDGNAGYTDGSELYLPSDEWQELAYDIPFELFKESIKISHTISDSNVQITPARKRVAQSIVPPVDTVIDIISICASKVGDPGGEVRIGVHEADGGVPSGLIASGGIDSSNIGPTAKWHQVRLSAPVTMRAGHRYCIVIRSNKNVDATNYYKISTDSGAGFAGGYALEMVDSGWRQISSDIVFRASKEEQSLTYATHDSSVIELGYTNQKVAQQFLMSASTSVIKARVFVRKVGEPGGLSVTLVSDRAGKPDTILANSTIDDSNISASFSWLETQFEPTGLSAGSVCWLVLSATGDVANYYEVSADSSAGYSGGACSNQAGSNWVNGDSSIPFKLYKSNIAHQFTTIGSTVLTMGIDIKKLAQCITHSSSITVTAVSVYAIRGGDPGSLRVSIWSSVDDLPGEKLEETSVESDSVSRVDYGFYVAYLPSPLTLEANTPYFIIIESSDVNGSNFYRFKVDSDCGYSGGIGLKENSDTWILLDDDIQFKLFKIDTFINNTAVDSSYVDVGNINSAIIQTFDTSEPVDVCRVGARFALKGDGDKVSNMTIALRVVKSESDSFTLLDSVASSTVDARTVDTTQKWYYSSFESVTLEPGKLYGIALSAEGDKDNYYRVQVDGLRRYNGGVLMVDVAPTPSTGDADMVFRVGGS